MGPDPTHRKYDWKFSLKWGSDSYAVWSCLGCMRYWEQSAPTRGKQRKAEQQMWLHDERLQAGDRKAHYPTKPTDNYIPDMVTREVRVQVHARGEPKLKQRGDRVGMRGLLYFLKSHPMKDRGPTVWQMMDLKIWMYTERYRRQGGKKESQADDGNNAKGPRNFWVKLQVEQSQKLYPEQGWGPTVCRDQF